MKKLVTAACALVAASAFAVESANVVGYTTVSLQDGQEYQLLGIPFESVSNRENGENLGIPVQDLFPDPIGQGFVPGTAAAYADKLQFWKTSGGYFELYLNSNTLASATFKARVNKWCNGGVLPDASWGTANNASTKTLTPGMAFWIKRYMGTASAPIARGPQTFTISGQVVVSDPVNREISAQYTLLSSAFSGPFVPNPDLAGTGEAIDWIGLGAHPGTAAAYADKLQFWKDSGGYFELYLNSNTLASATFKARVNKWCNGGVLPDASWGTANNPTIKKIDPGVGFWYRRYDATEPAWNLPQSQPYTLD